MRSGMAGQLAQALTLRLPPLTRSTRCDESGESHDGPLDVARRITGRSALVKAEESGYRAYPRLSAEFGAGV